jgi:hypothetical protein
VTVQVDFVAGLDSFEGLLVVLAPSACLAGQADREPRNLLKLTLNHFRLDLSTVIHEYALYLVVQLRIPMEVIAGKQVDRVIGRQLRPVISRITVFQRMRTYCWQERDGVLVANICAKHSEQRFIRPRVWRFSCHIERFVVEGVPGEPSIPQP